jgi:hypothetical protein
VVCNLHAICYAGRGNSKQIRRLKQHVTSSKKRNSKPQAYN